MARYMFGKRTSDGHIICINELTTATNLDAVRGYRCGCICPKCGTQLSAKLGEEREHHFAHKQSAYSRDCSPETANETALHQMAKEVLCEQKEILQPVYKIEADKALPERIPPKIRGTLDIPSEYVAKEENLLSFKTATAEKQMKDIRPDITAETTEGIYYFIEIFVNHRTKAKKKAKLQALKIPTLEVDLSGYVNEGLTKADLVEIFRSSKHTSWIYHPQEDEFLEQAKKFYSNLNSIKQYLEESAEKERKAAFLKELLKNPELYKRAVQDNQHPFLPKEVKWCTFYKDHSEVPFFINVPIQGEIVFQCDRRIWQSYIFNQFIYDGIENVTGFDGKKLLVYVENFLKNHGYYMKKDLMYRIELDDMPRCNGSYHFPSDVIKTYLNYLTQLGFIIQTGNRCEVLQRKIIVPPNKQYSSFLEKAINECDPYRFDIDSQLARSIHSQERELQKREFERQEYQKHLAAQKQAEEIAAAKKAENEKYQQEIDQIKSLDFSLDEDVIDSKGTRWIQCSVCGKIKPAHEMWNYRFGKGRCNKC